MEGNALSTIRFRDLCPPIRAGVSVRGKIFVIQSLYRDDAGQGVNDKPCRLLFLLEAFGMHPPSVSPPYALPNPYGTIAMWSTSLETPGAAHAARSAASFSNQERTFPCRVTVLPSAETEILRASTSALRRSASSILVFT